MFIRTSETLVQGRVEGLAVQSHVVEFALARGVLEVIGMAGETTVAVRVQGLAVEIIRVLGAGVGALEVVGVFALGTLVGVFVSGAVVDVSNGTLVVFEEEAVLAFGADAIGTVELTVLDALVHIFTFVAIEELALVAFLTLVGVVFILYTPVHILLHTFFSIGIHEESILADVAVDLVVLEHLAIGVGLGNNTFLVIIKRTT